MRLGATIRIAAAVLAMSSAGAATSSPSAAGLTVSAVKFWSLGNSTRIAIEVSADFQYHKSRLDNPDRLFFDIAGAEPRIEGAKPRGMHTIPVNDKFVKQIRIAEPQRGTTRVVLDLESGIEYTASQLTGPDRLMIEITAPGRSEMPSVTPSVVGIKRFEPPPVTLSNVSKPAPAIGLIDDQPPEIATRPVPVNPLPSPKRRRLLAMAAAPAPAVSTTPIVSESMIPLKPIPSLDGAPLPAKHGAVAGNPSMTRVFGLKIKRIIIDAGHGGKDQGTHGPNGLLEKDVVLDVAKRVGTLVQDRLGVEVIYTRDGDTFIPLEQRTQFANEQRGDLFISIHANSSTIRSVTGVEIYVLNFSNSKADLDTAARENAGAESSVYELESLLQKAMLNDKLKESSEFAGKVLQSMAGPATSKTRSRGVRRAPFVVLIGARMPSILAEIGFISNPADEALMAKPAQRQKIADALVRGIVDYAQSLSHLQVAEQPVRAATVSSSRQSPSSNKAAQ